MIRIGFFLLLIAAVLPACASDAGCPPAVQTPTPEMMQAAKLNARDHGFLWRISKDGHTSFLYGTMHVGRFEWSFPGPNVTQALRATDTVALELDMLDAGIQERLIVGMAKMRSTALPELLVKRIREDAESVCVPYAAIAMLAPEMQIDMLTLGVGQREGLDAGYATDAILASFGHDENKNVVSLETPEAQLQLMEMGDARQTIAFVEDGLDELESGRARTLLIRIARAWAEADYADMEHFEQWCECLNTEIERGVMKKLLDDRNPELAARIDALHASGKRVFAAVGSLHMFGPVGLPTLMAKRGYRVERVELKPR
jgi:uncharacterized protein YbaP (TraB family)